MIKESHGKFLYRTAVALFLFLAPVAVHACSYAIDPDNPGFDPDAERNYYGQYFFFATWALLLLNIGFLFFSSKKYVWGVVALILVIPVQLTAFVGSMLMDSCGFSYHQLIRYESGILFTALVLQVAQFVYHKGRAKHQ